MLASDYLRARNESENAFAKRAGLEQRSLSRALRRGSCSLRFAYMIVQASRKEPTPEGGTITYEDLLVPCEPNWKRAA